MNPDERVVPPQAADERVTLSAYLDYHRATLELKCSGLTDDELRQRAVPPSSLSLLGLVRHITDVERSWFNNGFLGRRLPPLYSSDPDNSNGDFDDLDSPPVAEVFATYRAVCAEAREIVAGAGSLDDVSVPGSGYKYSLRWIMLHMLEEYARHNGHADLLRERIDGVVGE